MALNTYTGLKSSIANWLNRSDLTTEISEDFVTLAEADFNSKLRIREMVNAANLTVNTETVALPAGFLQVRDLYIIQSNTKYPLRYVTPVQMDQMTGTSTSGLPNVYTILGSNLRFSPKPDQSYTAVLNFYKTFDPLTTSNTTNFILTNHPAIYLYGSLFHAANFLGGINPQQSQAWQGMYATALERLEINDREDQFSGSPLQIRSEDTVASPFNSNQNRIATNT